MQIGQEEERRRRAEGRVEGEGKGEMQYGTQSEDLIGLSRTSSRDRVGESGHTCMTMIYGTEI